MQKLPKSKNLQFLKGKMRDFFSWTEDALELLLKGDSNAVHPPPIDELQLIQPEEDIVVYINVSVSVSGVWADKNSGVVWTQT